jgi:UTP--glucose-1-phosphate uridylyltransferase
MRITKAVITAAGRRQRSLPLQTLIDRDGAQKSVLRIIIEEALRAGVEDICVVVCPGDEAVYAGATGDIAAQLTFVPQAEPLGYGHAVYCAHEFVDSQPFLHLVGDHLWVSRTGQGCAEQIVEVAQAESCAVSAVQASRESLLPYYGTVGGRRVAGRPDLYVVEDVIEKPTPTEAEQRLLVPGLRAGHYLCFFGIHVLTPAVMEILGRHVAGGHSSITLSSALVELAKGERYLALERPWWRYDVGVKYGLLTAQLALALSGKDRDEVLAQMVELLAVREKQL